MADYREMTNKEVVIMMMFVFGFFSFMAYIYRAPPIIKAYQQEAHMRHCINAIPRPLSVTTFKRVIVENCGCDAFDYYTTKIHPEANLGGCGIYLYPDITREKFEKMITSLRQEYGGDK